MLSYRISNVSCFKAYSLKALSIKCCDFWIKRNLCVLATWCWMDDSIEKHWKALDHQSFVPRRLLEDHREHLSPEVACHLVSAEASLWGLSYKVICQAENAPQPRDGTNIRAALIKQLLNCKVWHDQSPYMTTWFCYEGLFARAECKDSCRLDGKVVNGVAGFCILQLTPNVSILSASSKREGTVRLKNRFPSCYVFKLISSLLPV